MWVMLLLFVAVLVLGLAIRFEVAADVFPMLGEPMPRVFRDWLWEEFGERIEEGRRLRALGVTDPSTFQLAAVVDYGESWVVQVEGPTGDREALIFLELRGRRCTMLRTRYSLAAPRAVTE